MAQEQVTRRFDRSHDPARVMALSDCVFAIVVTLLVLEVHVPELGRAQRLADALQEIRPSLAAFLISFVVSAIAWTAHRHLFAHVRLTDRNLGALLILVPATLYVIAIAIAGVAPIASFAIYAGAPILYFVVLILTRDQAPPDAAERNLS